MSTIGGKRHRGEKTREDKRREDKTRQEKRREEKRREDKTRQDKRTMSCAFIRASGSSRQRADLPSAAYKIHM